MMAEVVVVSQKALRRKRWPSLDVKDVWNQLGKLGDGWMGFNGNHIPEIGKGTCRVWEERRSMSHARTKRVEKLLNCNVGGESGMIELARKEAVELSKGQVSHVSYQKV